MYSIRESIRKSRNQSVKQCFFSKTANVNSINKEKLRREFYALL